MADYSSIFEAAGKQHNVDPALIRAVMYSGERSNGDPKAISPKGATGLMQLMPATAKEVGVTDINDPQQNIFGGAKYLSQMLDKYGSVPLALAAYNAGPGAVDKAGGIPDFPETQAYVKRTMSTYQGKTMSQQPQDPGADPLRALIATGGGAKQAAPASLADPLRTLIEQGAPGVSPQSAAPAPQATQEPGTLESIGAGAGKGFGKTVLGAQQLVGEGLKKLGGLGQSPTLTSVVAGQPPQNMLQRAGQWLVNDATQGAANLDAQAAPYAGAHPVAAAAGEVTGALVNPLNRLVPMGKGNTLLQLMGKGAAQGAISGALTPVQGGDSFWGDKAKQTALGGVIGGATPGAIGGIAAVTKYGGNALRSLIDPFTDAGQARIAGNLLDRFAAGGPATGNAAEIVPGSAPTLAQATGNAGLATLERGMQSSTPQGANAFAERAAQNSAARSAAMGNVTGTAADIASAEAARDQAATQALQNAFANKQPADVSGVLGTIDNILSGPSGKRDAVSQVLNNIRSKLVTGTPQTTATASPVLNAQGQPMWTQTSQNGQKFETDPEVLYNSVRKQIGDLLDKRLTNSNPAGLQASRELLQVRDALDNAIGNAAPGFKQYLSDYSAASKPINAMDYLQGLKLTDANGNVTLAKIQNALTNMRSQRAAPGANGAKAVSQSQIDALESIRDDLLRSGNSSLGKSIGSNTFQNLATNNILESALPGPVRSLVGGTSGPVGNMVGRVGNWIYGGANENIQNKLLDMMLQPQSGLAALQNVRRNAFAGQSPSNPLLERLAPYLVPAGAIGGVNMISGGK